MHIFTLNNVNDAIQRCRHDPIFASLETVIMLCFKVFISDPLKLDTLMKTCLGEYNRIHRIQIVPKLIYRCGFKHKTKIYSI